MFKLLSAGVSLIVRPADYCCNNKAVIFVAVKNELEKYCSDYMGDHYTILFRLSMKTGICIWIYGVMGRYGT